MVMLICQYRTRPVLELLKLVESDDQADAEVNPPPDRKRKRSASHEPSSSNEVQREMLRVMTAMRVSQNLHVNYLS